MPEVKRKKSLSRVTSLATVISTPMAKVGHVLQVSSWNYNSLSVQYRTVRWYRPRQVRDAHKTVSVLAIFERRSASFSWTRLHSPQVSEPFNVLRFDSAPSDIAAAEGNPSRFAVTPSRFQRKELFDKYNSLQVLSINVILSALLIEQNQNHVFSRPPQSTPCKQRQTRYWSEKYPCHDLRKQEIKYQEAVYELCCGEHDLVEDLHLVQKTYAHSLVHLNILTVSEVSNTVFHLQTTFILMHYFS